MMTEREYWEKCAAFHGHQCPGLTIGFKASLYAMDLLAIDFSEDEDVVCVTENDACGVDAVQVMLGCSVGKGNLLFRLRGKQAFSFFNRKTGKSVRLVLKSLPKMDRPEMFRWMQAQKPSDLFDVKEPGFVLPERARLFNTIICACCGETVSENMIRIENGKNVCLDCLHPYDRFNV